MRVWRDARAEAPLTSGGEGPPVRRARAAALLQRPAPECAARDALVPRAVASGDDDVRVAQKLLQRRRARRTHQADVHGRALQQSRAREDCGITSRAKRVPARRVDETW